MRALEPELQGMFNNHDEIVSQLLCLAYQKAATTDIEMLPGIDSWHDSVSGFLKDENSTLVLMLSYNIGVDTHGVILNVAV